MPPSVDSRTCTPSACLTRSTPKKRFNSRCTKVVTDGLRKKSRVGSSLSETSPRRSDNLDPMGQLTQESMQNRNSPDNDAYVHLDLPGSGRPQQGCFPSTQKDEDFLKRAPFGKEERLASEDLNGSVRSMILHLASLTRSTLVAYEKERNVENRGNAALNEAVASDLAWLRTFHEAATLELSQLRLSNEAAAAEIANLQLENAHLAKKEAAVSSRLDEFQRLCVMRDAVNILAAFVMSKALMFKEQAELDAVGSSEIDKLRFEKARVIKETRDVEEHRRLQILELQSSLAAAEKELSKLSSEKAELMKDFDEKEVKRSLANDDMLCRLEAANEEVQQLRLNNEALHREKDEAALELDKMESRNEMQFREIQTAKEIEIVRMNLTLERTTGSLQKVILEKEEMAREKVVTESRTKLEVTQLQFEKAALVAELEKTTATANRQFQRLNSSLENAIGKLETLQRTTGLEKAELQSEIKAKNSELEQFKKKLVEVQVKAATREAQRAAEVNRLSRETEEGHAREAGLLEKLRAMTASPRSHAEMHLAFLINCGIIRPEDHSLNLMSHGRS